MRRRGKRRDFMSKWPFLQIWAFLLRVDVVVVNFVGFCDFLSFAVVYVVAVFVVVFVAVVVFVVAVVVDVVFVAVVFVSMVLEERLDLIVKIVVKLIVEFFVVECLVVVLLFVVVVEWQQKLRQRLGPWREQSLWTCPGGGSGGGGVAVDCFSLCHNHTTS